MTAPDPVSIGTFLAGAAWLAAIVASCAVAATLAVGWRRDLEPAFRVVGGAALTVAAVIVVHLVPGAAGMLRRSTVLATALVLVAAVALIDRKVVRGRRREAPSGSGTSTWIDWLPAALAIVAVLGFALAFLDLRRAQAIDEVDSLMFHLPQVVRWIQTGSFWQVDDFAAGWAFGNYPNGGNVLQLAVVLPWRDDAFVRFLNLPLLVLAAGAVATATRELGARWPTAALMGALAASVPVMATVSLNGANTDPIAYAGIAVAGAFLVRAHRSGHIGDLVLAGVGLGLAFGSKWYGVSSAVLLVVLWAGWRLAARGGRRRWRQIAVGVGALAAGSVVLGGFWLVRNAALVGNPVFPVRVALGDLVLFDAPPDHMRARLGSSILDYAGDADILRDYVWLGFRTSFGWPGAIAAVGVVAAVVIARRRRASVPAAVAVGAAALAALYVATPYTAMGPDGDPFLIGAATRYAGPVFALALPAAGWALARARPRLRRALEWVGVLAVVAGLRGATLLLGTSTGEVVTFRRAAVVAVALAGVLATVAVVVALRRSQRPGAARLVAVAVIVIVVGGALVAARVVQDDVRAGRYAGVDPVYDAVLAAAPAGHTIGLAGEYGGVNPPPLILHGYRFGNRVVYIGPVVEERLERYRDGDAFRRGLARSGADYLVVALGSPARPDVVHEEERWAREAGWEPVVRSDRLALLRR